MPVAVSLLGNEPLSGCIAGAHVASRLSRLCLVGPRGLSMRRRVRYQHRHLGILGHIRDKRSILPTLPLHHTSFKIGNGMSHRPTALALELPPLALAIRDAHGRMMRHCVYWIRPGFLAYIDICFC